MSTLSREQKIAAEAFFIFLFSNKKEFSLSGAGGTGKTFLINHMIRNVIPRYYATCKMLHIDPKYEEVYATATTNKATAVIRRLINGNAITIHSFMNLRPIDDYTTGQTFLVRSENWEEKQNVILFIDEASMADSRLIKYILEGTTNCKIVYVGDHCQLLPVKEASSPVYDREMPFFELTQPQRSDLTPINDLCTKLRSSVKTIQFSDIKIQPGVIDHFDDQKLKEYIFEKYRTHSDEYKIIAYTNERVNQYNDYIRTNIRRSTPHFYVGEELVNNTPFEHLDKKLYVPAEDQLIVTRVSNETRMMPMEYCDETDLPTVQLEVRPCSFECENGNTFSLPIAENKGHYYALLKYYASIKNWEKYFFLKKSIPDFRPRDACTLHKSQGSTYKEVVIDLEDISSCPDPKQVSRMLYVAFSRAQDRIILYGQLDPKYGKIIGA